MINLKILIMSISIDAGSLFSLVKLKIGHSSVDVKRNMGGDSSRCVGGNRRNISIILGDGGKVKVIINFIIFIFRMWVRQTNSSRIKY